jgi:hypothetical protein
VLIVVFISILVLKDCWVYATVAKRGAGCHSSIERQLSCNPGFSEPIFTPLKVKFHQHFRFVSAVFFGTKKIIIGEHLPMCE